MTGSAPRSPGEFGAALANAAKRLADDPAGAVALCRDVLLVEPHNGDALRLLARGLRARGCEAEAEQAEMDAIKASTHNPVLVRAAQAITLQRLEEAERLLRPYLKTSPDDAAATRMLAEIAIRMGADGDAEALLRHTLELAPAFNVARSRLAMILFRQNRPAESIAVLDELLSRDGANSEAGSSKAAALGRIGEYREAIGLYEQLLSDAPDRPHLWMSYGHVLKTVGRLQDCIAAYRRAAELEPSFGEAWWSLANLKTAHLDGGDVTTMAAALEQPGLREEAALHLHFALGKALEDEEQYEESFAHYAEGNRLRRDRVPHDADGVSDHVSRSIALLTPVFFTEREGAGCHRSGPIFILGMPRAGSTLLEQILSSHSQVEGTSELPLVPPLTHRLVTTAPDGAPLSYPDSLALLDPDRFADLGEDYLRGTVPYRKSGKPFFIDKLPNNWAHIGFIHLMLPGARIIDARRHPLDCGFSNFKQHFAHGQAFAYSLDDIGRYYADYVRLLDHYDRVLPGRVHRVIHERLIADPEAEIRALLDYLGLPFEEACLRFHENERAVRTPSAEQVRQPINDRGVGRWLSYERWLGPLKDALGPVLVHYPDTPPA